MTSRPLLFLLLLILGAGCSREEEIGVAINAPVSIVELGVVVVTNTPNPPVEVEVKVEEEVVQEPTPTLVEIIPEEEVVVPTPTPTPVPIPTTIPKVRVVEINLESPYLTTWFQNLYRNVEIHYVEEPNTPLIEEKLEGETRGSNWKMVQIPGGVYYTHSGWDLLWGPYLGDLLRRVVKAQETLWVTIDGVTYQMVANIDVPIGQNELDVSDFRDQFGEDLIFIVTCDYGRNVSLGVSPKLIVVLEKLE